MLNNVCLNGIRPTIVIMPDNGVCRTIIVQLVTMTLETRPYITCCKGVVTMFIITRCIVCARYNPVYGDVYCMCMGDFHIHAICVFRVVYNIIEGFLYCM